MRLREGWVHLIWRVLAIFLGLPKCWCLAWCDCVDWISVNICVFRWTHRADVYHVHLVWQALYELCNLVSYKLCNWAMASKKSGFCSPKSGSRFKLQDFFSNQQHLFKLSTASNQCLSPLQCENHLSKAELGNYLLVLSIEIERVRNGWAITWLWFSTEYLVKKDLVLQTTWSSKAYKLVACNDLLGYEPADSITMKLRLNGLGWGWLWQHCPSHWESKGS